MLTANNLLRSEDFKPYAGGYGPEFRLELWDTGRADRYGKSILGYRLFIRFKVEVVLFEGEDFHCSPMHAIDSHEAVAGIMAFLTLRPGDTDAGYFANYTPAQLAYCDMHAEALSCYVEDMFGSD